MNILVHHGIDYVFHIAPIHYLPFIAKSQKLKSKITLRNEGFLDTHFRSMSKNRDEERGFGDYIHLSTIAYPPILKSKLKGGFPHICIYIPTSALDNICYDLCKYNIAMSRELKKDGKGGVEEKPENGRYYGEMQIPIARTVQEQNALIASNKKEMLEVICKPPISLSPETLITTFSNDDRQLAQEILDGLGVDWGIQTAKENYQVSPKHNESCRLFIEKALADPDWKGDGLEFDKVKI